MDSSLIKSVVLSSTVALVISIASGCASQSADIPLGQAQSAWDFDHKVQYKKTKLDENTYQLEVIPNDKVNFERLSVFLLRRSYLICGGYGYKLELIKGVESFDHFKASPNMIMPNLTAKIECPTA
jgi:uncharacterized protein involved in propanediol utilization